MFVSEKSFFVRDVVNITSKNGYPITIVKVSDNETRENLDLFALKDVTTPPIKQDVRIRIKVESRGQGVSLNYAGYIK